MLKHSFHSAVRAASSGWSREHSGSCARSVKEVLTGLPSRRRSAVLDGERVRRVGARMKAAEPLQVKSLGGARM